MLQLVRRRLWYFFEIAAEKICVGKNLPNGGAAA
jgi:hypothetical protein